jgi:hypothetical protein
MNGCGEQEVMMTFEDGEEHLSVTGDPKARYSHS